MHLNEMTKQFLAPDAFVEMDKPDLLQYSMYLVNAQDSTLSELPPWLQFLSSLLLIVGSPEADLIRFCTPSGVREMPVDGLDSFGGVVHTTQRQCEFMLRIIADDGYSSTSQNVAVRVINTIPYKNAAVMNESGSETLIEIHPYAGREVRLIYESFLDFDKSDHLRYSLAQEGMPFLPSWIQFDP